MTTKLIAATLTLTLTTGCGTTMWLITPRPDTTYQEITTTTNVRVTSTTPGATVYVDGAESGPAPRSVSVAHKQLRRQKRQSILLALVGTTIDLALSLVVNVAAGNEEPDALTVTLPVSAAVLLTDLWLITAKSVKNEGLDTIPSATEISVRAPGFAEQSRKIRVPDITALTFQLAPVAPTPPGLTPPTPAAVAQQAAPSQ
jgi:hypothetical protein